MPAFKTIARRYMTGAVLLAAVGCVGADEPEVPGSNPAAETYAASLGVDISKMIKVSDALYYEDVVVGNSSAVAAAGKFLRITYTGYLVNGTSFDSNVGKASFDFTLGTGYVIEGWDKGIVGMREGGRRRLVIGSDMGYKGSAKTGIPANSTLVFDVQLLTIQ